jgi:methyl-accepting chemotaxis protein
MKLDLGIKSRLYGGFGVLVALSLALALFASWRLNLLSTALGRMSAISDSSTRVLEVSREFEIMWRSALRYKFDSNAASLRDGTEAAAKATTILPEAAKATPSEDRRKIYIGLEGSIAVFQKKRDALVEATKNVDAAGSKLFTIGDELTANADRLLEAGRANMDRSIAGEAVSVGIAVLLVRVANWRFQATQDPNGAATFEANLERANRAIASLEKAAPADDILGHIPALKASLAAYQQAFDSFSGNLTKSNDLYSNELVPQLVQMLERIGTAEASLKEDFDSTRLSTDQTISGTITTQAVIAAFALVLSGLIAFFVGRSIIRPVAGMTLAMGRLAAGDIDAEIPSRDREDEMGAMAKAVDIFKQNAIERIRLETRQKETEVRGAAKRKTEMHKLADQFESAVGGIIEMVSLASTKLEAAATTLTQTAESTQHLSMTVAAASEETSTNANSVAAASEELACYVVEIARQVKESSKIGTLAVTQAEKTDDRITKLSQSAERISDVIKLITAIAEHTNLLALNATIEAARAGESGKGFAVVAQEVKTLAAQTAKAADEISTQITDMQTATEESVTAIKEIGTTIDRIAEIASIIAAAVDHQGISTQEISRNIHQAAKGTSQIATSITDVSRGAIKTGSASAQVLESAQSLASQSNHLQIEVAKFLAMVRAA